MTDDRVSLTRPIASRAEAHAFEGADGSLLVVAWQRTATPGDGRRPSGDEPPRAPEEFTLFVPDRRPDPAPDGPGRADGVLETSHRDGGTSVRLRVTQDRTLVLRLAPKSPPEDR